jgi:hypothetical protein
LITPSPFLLAIVIVGKVELSLFCGFFFVHPRRVLTFFTWAAVSCCAAYCLSDGKDFFQHLPKVVLHLSKELRDPQMQEHLMQTLDLLQRWGWVSGWQGCTVTLKTM